MTIALLIIDVQRGLFDADPRPDDADAVIDRINDLATRARRADVPVVFIQHEAAGDLLKFGSDSWHLERRLQVQTGDHRVRKTTPDSFLRTNLGDLLAGQGATSLVICGYATEFCIDTTTRRAAALGFDVVLAADAHTTHDKPHAPAAFIRTHHTVTLPHLTSFGRRIEAVASADIRFSA